MPGKCLGCNRFSTCSYFSWAIFSSRRTPIQTSLPFKLRTTGNVPWHSSILAQLKSASDNARCLYWSTIAWDKSVNQHVFFCRSSSISSSRTLTTYYKDAEPEAEGHLVEDETCINDAYNPEQVRASCKCMHSMERILLPWKSVAVHSPAALVNAFTVQGVLETSNGSCLVEL